MKSLALLFLLSSPAFAARAIMEQTAASNNTIFVDTANVRVGISTNTPQTTLDVGGNAQFGNTFKSTFTANPGAGNYALQLSSGVQISSGGIISLTSGGAIVFSDGTSINSKTSAESNTFTSSKTFTNGSFSIAGSTFSVAGGSVTAQKISVSSLNVTGTGYSVNIASGVSIGGELFLKQLRFSDGTIMTSSPSATSGVFVAKAGDTMTGALTISENLGTPFIVNTATLVITSGRVGIGLTNPSYLLHGVSANANEARAYMNQTGGTDIAMGAGTTASVLGTVGSYPLAFITVNSERARFDTGGNLGLNTSSPTGLLDVNGYAVFRGSVSIPTISSSMTVQGNAFSVGGSSFTVAGGSATIAYQMTATKFSGSGAALTGLPSTSSIVGVYVATSGATMSGALTITGTSVTANALFGDGSHLTGITGTGEINTYSSSKTFNLGVLIATGTFSVGNSTLTVYNARVGVGTTNPDSLLEVAGAVHISANGLNIGSGVIGTHQLYVGSGSNLTVAAGGGVGIGAASVANSIFQSAYPFYETGTATFGSSVTFQASALLAAGATLQINGPLKVSSAGVVFDGTVAGSTYTLIISSGIEILNGGQILMSGPTGGIRWPNGSVSTSAFNNQGGGSGVTSVTYGSFTATGNTTWFRPTNVSTITIFCVGGGGGGAGAAANVAGGGGGGGGGVLHTFISVISSPTLGIVIGGGGSGGGGGSDGVTGSNTTIGSLIAYGGGGGGAGVATATGDAGLAGGSGGGGGGCGGSINSGAANCGAGGSGGGGGGCGSAGEQAPENGANDAVAPSAAGAVTGKGQGNIGGEGSGLNPSLSRGGMGGAGCMNPLSNDSAVYSCGGGGGGDGNLHGGSSCSSPGGGGTASVTTPANSGGGGGGGGHNTTGQAGGSGYCFISWIQYQ